MAKSNWQVGTSRNMYRKINGKQRFCKVTKTGRGKYKVTIITKRKIPKTLPVEKPYFYEIYTKNLKTGEGGWKIEVGQIEDAKDRQDAIRKIKRRYGPRFDQVIQAYRIAEIDEHYKEKYDFIR